MAKKRIRVYADTSVFGGAFDEEFRAATLAFIAQVQEGKFDLILSPLIEEELAQAPEKVRDLYGSVASFGEMIPLAEEALRLQEAYLGAGIVSAQWAADALHVAHATVSGCQIVVSWNFQHIVHYRRIPLYNAVNIRQGYSSIGIHSPQEVIEYEDEDV